MPEIIKQKARTILFDRRQRLVLVKRTRPGVVPYWTTAGGSVEPEDSGVEAALHREVLEESGGRIDRVRQVLVITGELPEGLLIQHVFVARLTAADPPAVPDRSSPIPHGEPTRSSPSPVPTKPSRASTCSRHRWHGSWRTTCAAWAPWWPTPTRRRPVREPVRPYVPDNGEKPTLRALCWRVEAAAREAREEVGAVIGPDLLEPAVVVHHPREPGHARIRAFFVATRWRGEPHSAEPAEAGKLVWAHPNLLPSNTIPYPAAGIRAWFEGTRFVPRGWWSPQACAARTRVS